MNPSDNKDRLRRMQVFLWKWSCRASRIWGLTLFSLSGVAATWSSNSSSVRTLTNSSESAGRCRRAHTHTHSFTVHQQKNVNFPSFYAAMITRMSGTDLKLSCLGKNNQTPGFQLEFGARAGCICFGCQPVICCARGP